MFFILLLSFAFLYLEPIQIHLVLLSKLELLRKKSPSVEIFKTDILPIVYQALDLKVPTVQERALKVIPSVFDVLDYNAIKNQLFPRIQVNISFFYNLSC